MMRGIDLVPRAGDRMALPEVLRPAIAGLFVGLLALKLPEILGVGYEQTDGALRNIYPLAIVFTLIAAKLLATILCLGWGFGGGVFSPSLALGALVGVAVGTAATMVGQDLSSGSGAYALVGMGALAAAVLGAPISTTLIIFELTGDYALTIAAMVGVVTVTLVSTQLYGLKSFFLGQLRDDGIILDGGQDVSGLKGTTIADYLAPSASTCKADSTRADVRSMLLSCNVEEIYVVDAAGVYAGVVSGSDLAEPRDTDDAETVTDLIHDSKSVVLAGDTIEHGVRAILAAKTNRLPVIDDAETQTLIGTVAAQDLLRAVNLALLDVAAEAQGSSQTTGKVLPKTVQQGVGAGSGRAWMCEGRVQCEAGGHGRKKNARKKSGL
jgi:CIC family chloride channel protein